MADFQKGAVVVLFIPDDDVLGKIKLYSSLLNYVFVYDNTPDGMIDDTGVCKRNLYEELCELKNVCYFSEGKNAGVATALNRGVEWCIEQGCEEVFLFDQDSKPATYDFFEKMSQELFQLNAHDDRIVSLAPDIKDEASPEVSYKWLANNKSLFFRRLSLKDNWNGEVLVAITSGTLIYSSVFKDVGRFRDDFFIDYVDTEYCLRMINKGYKILASKTAVLLHNLGARSEHKVAGIKFYPTNHAAIRRYYIARNSVYMWKMYALKNFNWAMFDLVASIYNAFRVLAFEDKKSVKIKASLQGFYDGFCGKFGERNKG